jgi:guanylate kinase
MGLSISATTRTPRENERDGSSYFFLSREAFRAKAAAGEFFEWEEIHGNLYGTLRSTVDEALERGHDLLLDIDIRGALNFKRALPNSTVIVFLVPPSIEVLKKRLLARGKISEQELQTRLGTAEREYQQLLELQDKPGAIDYFVVNDSVEDTYALLNAIVAAERARLIRMKQSDIRAICHV